MSAEIVTLTPALTQAYESALKGFAGCSIYHTSAWRQFLAEAFGAQPITLLAMRGADVVGIMPLAAVRKSAGGWRVASLPYSHYVPSLGSEDVAVSLRSVAAELARSTYGCELELRGGVAHPETSVMTTTVSVTPMFDTMRRQLDRKTRNQLGQAERNERLTMRLASSNADFATMDYIMAVNRRELGSATYARGVFGVLKAMAGNLVHTMLACYDEKPVAFMVTSSVGESAIYHYGASLPEYRAARPNNILMWDALCWAATQGARVIDLGTSLTSQTGLIRFKEGWGGASSALSYTKVRADGTLWVPRSLQDSLSARAAGYLLRCLPLAAYRWISPPLVRNLG